MALVKQPGGKNGRAVWTGDGIKVVKTDDGALVYSEGADEPEEITAEAADELVGTTETCETVQKNGEVCGRKLPCRRVGHR